MWLYNNNVIVMKTKKKSYKMGEYEYDVPDDDDILELLKAVPIGKSKPTKKVKSYDEDEFLTHMSELV